MTLTYLPTRRSVARVYDKRVPSLVLIRHAKAADGSVDVERPLAPRGFSDAAEIGRWLGEQKISPDRAVVSTALRARQTWDVATGSPSVLDERIYTNTVESLLEVIRETPADVSTLVIVGHNPSIQELAKALDPQKIDQFPTAAVAVFEVNGDWAAMSEDNARLVQFGRR